MDENIKGELFDRAEQFERTLIGCIINGGDINTVKGMINADAFVSGDCRIVWEAMLDLSEKKEVPTAQVLFERLKGHEQFDNSVDLKYAIKGDLDSGVPHFIKRSAADLSSAHTRYHLALTCEGVLKEIAASEHEVPTDKLLLDIREAVDKMKVESGFKSSGILATSSQMLENIANPPAITKTGFKTYDHVLGGGFIAGETYTLAGANKSGKTMMAGSISAALNTVGIRHQYLCLEMGSLQISQRMIAAQMGFPTYDFMHEYKRTSQELADRIIQWQGWAVNHDNIVFTDCPLLRASDAKAILYRAKMDGCEGVIIDYFSLIAPDLGFKGNQNEHQDQLAQELTKTAKDLGIWVLMIAQTNASGSTYGSAALLRASTHIAVLERVEDQETAKQGFRWLRTISARLTMAEDIGSLDEAGLKIHKNGSHVEELVYQDPEEENLF